MVVLPRLAGVCFFFLFHISVSVSLPESSILRNLPETDASLSAGDFSVHDNIITPEDFLFCDSWRYTVETNDAGSWIQFPPRCKEFVKDYMTGKRYSSDCEAVAECSSVFAKSVNVSGDGKDAWIFDVDDTLLSNVGFYFPNGSKANSKQSIDYYAPAIPSSLKLYNELKNLKFKIFLLTGRVEALRRGTILNLEYVGYLSWERLIMRGKDDEGTLASVYKSKKRKELENEGYRIRGNSGDQWSDLIGYSVAERSFKIPNPMYYVA